MARLTALLPLMIFVGLCTRVPAAVGGGAVFMSWEWVPGIGVNLDVAVDGLSVLFGLIITGTGVFVVLFSADYMAGHRHYARFFVFLHLFLLAMLGLVLADNLITLFVFWELTTLLSYLLIGFDNQNEHARSHARQALLVTGGGGLALLIGFLMIGGIVDTYRLSALAEQARFLQRHTNYLFILAMVLIGAFTKSAQFPFHFWLPNAMAAPTPISAFLHSATMVKAGIYLLARFHPVLGGTEAWMGTLVVVGGVTALLGAVLAVGQSDLKRMLAYTTIMALGILVMFLGGKTTPALTAAVTFLLVHSLYKSALFLVVGIIDHETGTREVETHRRVDSQHAHHHIRRRHRSHVHGWLSPVSGVHRQGDHVRGRPDRRDVPGFCHHRGSAVQRPDGRRCRHDCDPPVFGTSATDAQSHPTRHPSACGWARRPSAHWV